MAAGGKGKNSKTKEKAPKKPRNIHTLYQISGDSITRKNKSCPKCGAGYFLAQHKDRAVCGKCSYTEFASKNEEAQV